MKLTKNKLTLNQSHSLLQNIKKFLKESKLKYSEGKFLLNTIKNIRAGMEGISPHHIWISDECYCLCRVEKDSDGELVYTAYQLWIEPKQRSLSNVRKLINFLKFYTQKQGYKRLYIPSSRLDSIKAYSRGLGNQFKLKTATFVQEM